MLNDFNLNISQFIGIVLQDFGHWKLETSSNIEIYLAQKILFNYERRFVH